MPVSSKATQDFVPVKEVRNGIIVLKDGGLRSVLMASSVNLALKSSDEQQAVLYQFQAFLNSLDFSVQILVQSRRLDIRPYLLTLENRMQEQTEPLLKVQTKEYIGFIRSFTEQVSIMTKSFYIVVPYSAPVLGAGGGGLKSFFPGSSKTTTQAQDETLAFEESRTQLEQRVGVVQEGLSRTGIRSVQLGTEEVVELLYKTFNPGETTASIKF